MVRSRGTKVGDVFIVIFCCLLILICILPIVNIAARSLSHADALIRQEVTLWPIGYDTVAQRTSPSPQWWEYSAYSDVIGAKKYTDSLAFTAVLTVICVGVSLLMTTLCAYPLTYDNLPGRKFFNTVALITMYFGAGTIPMYLLMKSYNLLENPLALVLPGCLSVFNMILMRSFFYGIPMSLRESAEIDGAGPLTVLTRIYLPLSMPVVATLALFYAVGRWNGYTDALLYIRQNSQFHPIQLLLYNLLNNATNLEVANLEGWSAPGKPESIKSATIMFATVPILLVYPWLQRYFIAGVTLGAVKE